MTTHPSAQELLRAVSEWIEEVRPQLDDRNAFLARVAANALAIVGRELTQAAAAQDSATRRLSKLLAREGGYEELTRELCDRLRTGQLDAATPGLLATLRAGVLEQLAIDQPGYRHETTFAHAMRGPPDVE